MGEDGPNWDTYAAPLWGPRRLRALAVDLDMTTLDSKGKLPLQNRNALERFRKENGGPVVVATGRPRVAWSGGNMSLPEALEGVNQIGDAVTHVVCQDGQVVMERCPLGKGDGWRTTTCNMRTYPEASRILRRIQESKAFPEDSLHFGLFPPNGGGQVLAEHGLGEMLKLNPRYPKMMLESRPHKLVPCIQQALRDGYEPPLVDENRIEDTYVGWVYIVPRMLGLSAQELMDRVQPILDMEAKETGVRWRTWTSGWRLDPDGKPVTKNWPNLPPETVKEGTGAITLMPVGVSKATGLAQLSDQFGLGQEGTGWMAFGDTTNDLEMLQWAEWSVAPRNAKNPKAKETAKEVSEFTNDECCVARAIERALGSRPRNREPVSVAMMPSKL